MRVASWSFCARTSNSGTAVRSRRSPSARANSACAAGEAFANSLSIVLVTFLPRNSVNDRRAASCSSALADAATSAKSATIEASPKCPNALSAARRTAGSPLLLSAAMADAAERSPRCDRPSIKVACTVGSTLGSNPASARVRPRTCSSGTDCNAATWLGPLSPAMASVIKARAPRRDARIIPR